MKRYTIMAIDPLHVGTGGYRLGLVDLSIVREPGTSLPKIPGTSLHGTLRAYAAHLYNKKGCAGPGMSEDAQRHCGGSDCPLCYTFGFTAGTSSGNKGVVNIYDARILLFPVYSMYGPVWVSTMHGFEEFGLRVEGGDNQSSWATGELKRNLINLGWLMVEIKGKVNIENIDSPEWESVKNRIVFVPENLFSQIVNSNLEIRTSVSIDPETGAASETALFTYEALPRSAFLWFDVTEDDYRCTFPKTERVYDKTKGDNSGEPLKRPWDSPLDVVEAGLELAEHLGIGGMDTRGFGRVRTVAGWEV
jgi:CRISPR-associated protein Cmr4